MSEEQIYRRLVGVLLLWGLVPLPFMYMWQIFLPGLESHSLSGMIRITDSQILRRPIVILHQGTGRRGCCRKLDDLEFTFLDT